jgi:uncharacterized membrane protein
MSELIVVGFHGKHRAAEVLDELQQLNEDWMLDLEDGVAAYRRDNGKFRVEQSVNPTSREGAALGGSFGLMVGALLAAPFTAGDSAAAAAAAIGTSALATGTIGAALGDMDASDWKAQYGITDEFVRQIGGMIQPGDSAVFALLHSANPTIVAEHFARYGGKLLRTSLTPVAAARLPETLRA